MWQLWHTGGVSPNACSGWFARVIPERFSQGAANLEDTVNIFKSRMLAFVVCSLTVAAVLGGSLGIVAAGSRPSLGTGFNLVGGPLSESVAPDKFVGCLPSTSWDAVYVWDSSNQTWKHYFNKANGTPEYVNSTSAGGIGSIPRLSGVVLIMKTAVSNPFIPDRASENCP